MGWSWNPGCGCRSESINIGSCLSLMLRLVVLLVERFLTDGSNFVTFLGYLYFQPHSYLPLIVSDRGEPCACMGPLEG